MDKLIHINNYNAVDINRQHNNTTPKNIYDISQIAHALGQAKKTTNGYNCLCPAHDDHVPSLLLGIHPDGNLSATCFAGCSYSDIINEIKKRGLLPNYSNKSPKWNNKSDVTPFNINHKSKNISKVIIPVSDISELNDKCQVSLKAKAEWESFSDQGSSSYLKRKQIKAYGIRFGEDCIVVPLRDADGKLWSWQKIFENGDKKFMSGGRTKGHFHIIGTIKEDQPLFVAEGYATAASIYMATDYPVVIAFNAGNLSSVTEEFRRRYPHLNIIIAGDDDRWKDSLNPGKLKAEEAATKYNCGVVFPRFDPTYDNEKPTDFNDLHCLQGLEEVTEQLKNHINSICNFINHTNSRENLDYMNINEILIWDKPAREMILDPVIPEQGLVMLHAYRGIGKTYVGMEIAITVAEGGIMFGGKWRCSQSRRVLFVDGEMAGSDLKERFLRLITIHGSNVLQYSENLNVITPDRLMEKGSRIKDLSTPEGKEWLEKHLNGGELIILDNLSCLFHNGHENESDSWIKNQEWFLKLRSKGYSVLLIHHDGKNGNQRGTSKHEDVVDTSIQLKRPGDYKTNQGARFEVHHSKTRGFYGDNANPFEAWLKTENGQSKWEIKDKNQADILTDKSSELFKKGYNQTQIAKELGISQSKVSRLIKNE